MIGAGPTRRAGARESKERKQARTHPSPSPRRPRLSKIASPQTPEVDNAFGNRIKNFLTKIQLYLFALSPLYSPPPLLFSSMDLAPTNGLHDAPPLFDNFSRFVSSRRPPPPPPPPPPRARNFRLLSASPPPSSSSSLADGRRRCLVVVVVVVASSKPPFVSSRSSHAGRDHRRPFPRRHCESAVDGSSRCRSRGGCPARQVSCRQVCVSSHLSPAW